MRACALQRGLPFGDGMRRRRFKSSIAYPDYYLFGGDAFYGVAGRCWRTKSLPSHFARAYGALLPHFYRTRAAALAVPFKTAACLQ